MDTSIKKLFIGLRVKHSPSVDVGSGPILMVFL